MNLKLQKAKFQIEVAIILIEEELNKETLMAESTVLFHGQEVQEDIDALESAKCNLVEAIKCIKKVK